MVVLRTEELQTRILYLIDFMGELSLEFHRRELVVYLRTEKLQMNVALGKVEHLFHQSMLASSILRDEEVSINRSRTSR